MRGPTGSARSIGSRIAALRLIGATPQHRFAPHRRRHGFTGSVDQLTHSGWSAPAVRIGDGGGAADLPFDDAPGPARLPPSPTPEPGPRPAVARPPPTP